MCSLNGSPNPSAMTGNLCIFDLVDMSSLYFTFTLAKKLLVFCLVGLLHLPNHIKNTLAFLSVAQKHTWTDHTASYWLSALMGPGTLSHSSSTLCLFWSSQNRKLPNSKAEKDVAAPSFREIETWKSRKEPLPLRMLIVLSSLLLSVLLPREFPWFSPNTRWLCFLWTFCSLITIASKRLRLSMAPAQFLTLYDLSVKFSWLCDLVQIFKTKNRIDSA